MEAVKKQKKQDGGILLDMERKMLNKIQELRKELRI